MIKKNEIRGKKKNQNFKTFSDIPDKDRVYITIKYDRIEYENPGGRRGSKPYDVSSYTINDIMRLFGKTKCFLIKHDL